MPLSPRNVSIGAAILFSLLLVGAAYFLSSPYGVLRADAQSSEEILRAYAKKDADADGLYDWQESLYGTDPLNAHSVDPQMTDAEAVAAELVAPKYVSELPKREMPTKEELDETLGPAPAAGSLTEQFSREFIEKYLAANGDQVLSQGAQDVFVQELLKDFSQRAARQLGSAYTLTSVRQGNVAIADYAAALEEAVTDHTLTVETADPITLMDAFLVKGDSSTRTKIATLRDTYERILGNLLSMEVPSAHANDHLILIRAYDTLALAMDVTVRYEEDPLAVMGVLAVYPDAARGVLEAGANVGRALVREGKMPQEGEPGRMFIEVMQFIDSL